MVEGPRSVFIVPLHEDRRTILVRQWRHAWAASSWEVPAGTLEEAEAPEAGARRELDEEAGLRASEWIDLGVTRGTAGGDLLGYLYLARGLTTVPRAPEAYEHDMITLDIPFTDALEEALTGGIAHSASAAAITRAARHLGLV